MSIPTPHIQVRNKQEFAKTVIMPGDPNRAKYIAKKFLKKYKLINKVRGILAFTGFYKGKKVTIMASGMGCPSMGIYSYELFNFYDVQNIIRVGSCGTYKQDLKLGDIIICKKSITNSNYANIQKNKDYIIACSSMLSKKAENAAKQNSISYKIGNIFCTDTFYTNDNQEQVLKDNDCLGVEMESAALYFNAKKAKKNAIAICSVSDNIKTGDKLTAKQRETSFNNMIILALEMVENE